MDELCNFLVRKKQIEYEETNLNVETDQEIQKLNQIVDNFSNYCIFWKFITDWNLVRFFFYDTFLLNQK